MHTFRTRHGSINYNSDGSGRAIIKYSGREDTVEVECCDLFDFVDFLRGRIVEAKTQEL